jgi:hypothetical protein
MVAVGAEVAGDERGACSKCLSKVMPREVSSGATDSVGVSDIAAGTVRPEGGQPQSKAGDGTIPG